MRSVGDHLEQVLRLQATGASGEAQELLERPVSQNPDDPRVHLTAETYHGCSRRDRARQALKRAARLAPGWIEAYVYLAASHQVGGQRRCALEDARRGLHASRRHWDEVSPRDYVELLFKEAEAPRARGERSAALRRGLERLGASARVAAPARVEGWTGLSFEDFQ